MFPSSRVGKHNITHWHQVNISEGNIKGGSTTVPLTSCLTGLDQPVLQIKTKIVSSHTDDSNDDYEHPEYFIFI